MKKIFNFFYIYIIYKMFQIKVTNKTSEYIFHAIKKYYKKYENSNVQKHLNITKSQLSNLYQQMDTGGPYKKFDDMYDNFNKEIGTNSKIKITKTKYKNAVFLLLGYYKGIIEF